MKMTVYPSHTEPVLIFDNEPIKTKIFFKNNNNNIEEDPTMKDFTADSFGSECPVNWEEICDALNAIAEDLGISGDIDATNELWEDYFNGKYPEAPAPKMSWEISLDNGVHFMSAEEAMSEIIEKDMWNVIEAWMDDDTREEVYREDEYSPEDFLRRYLELAPGNLIIG